MATVTRLAKLTPLNAAARDVCVRYGWDAGTIDQLFQTVQFGSRAECGDAQHMRAVYFRAWRWAVAGRDSAPPID